MTQPEKPRNLGTLYDDKKPVVIHPIKDLEGKEFVEEPFPDGACLIGEDTRVIILSALNIVENADGTIQTVPSRGFAVKHPYTKAVEITNNIFSLFKDIDGGMMDQASSWTKRTFNNQPQADSLRDAATVGMGVVLTAFHTEVGPEFIDKAKKLNPDVLTSVFRNGASVNDNKTIFGRMMNIEQIPEFQINLNGILSELGHYVTYPNTMMLGAVEMYRVIDTMWDFLKKD